MATAIQVGDILSVRAWLTLGTQAAVNTYNFLCTSSAGTGATDADVALDMDTLMAGFYGSGCSNATRYDGVQVYFLKHPLGLPAPVSHTSGAGMCTGGTLTLPRSAAPIMSYQTGGRGPGARGRIFIPFFPTTVMDANGELTSGGKTYINTFAASLLGPHTFGSGGNTSVLIWGLLKRKPTLGLTVITAAEASGKFGNQHRRGDYGRPNTSPI